MNTAWETIAHCLRDELQEYGGLLSLFEEQQGALYRRDASAVLAAVSAIEEQARVAAKKRLDRESIVRGFAAEHGCAADASLRQLLPYFPAEVRPMLQALVDEVNRLIHRARRGVRQNAMLLQRAVEMHQEALRTLRPDAFTKTYSPYGQVSVAPSLPVAAAALHAVG
jgi:flagellar biosynthesis/type III secretory pathway chaperone